jgi:spore coat protein U-like protein
VTARLGRLAAGALLAVLLCGRDSEAACTISVTPVNFGAYDPFSGTPTDSTGTITYQCNTPGEDIRIELDTGGGADFQGRRMLSGSEPLFFNLYLNAARTTIWGNGTAGTGVHLDGNVPKNKTINVTVYGRIGAGQDVVAGSYTNTITALLLW